MENVTDNARIYRKLADIAAGIFGALKGVEAKTYTAAMLKAKEAVSFRAALGEWESEHGVQEYTVEDGAYRLGVTSSSVWTMLLRFEQLARIPEARRVRFTASSQSPVVCTLRVTLPAGVGACGDYVAKSKTDIRLQPRFKTPWIDANEGLVFATQGSVIHISLVRVEGDADRAMPLPAELAKRFAGRRVELTYHEDGTLVCRGGDDSVTYTYDYDLRGNMGVRRVLPKVSGQARVKVSPRHEQQLMKFLKLQSKGGCDKVSVIAERDGMTVEAGGSRISVSLEEPCDARLAMNINPDFLRRAIADGGRRIWFPKRGAAAIMDSGTEDTFVIAMTYCDGDADNIERTQEYLTIKTDKDMKITETPLMRQYEEMRKKHPDAVLLFRCGDFYEVFREDAVVCSDVLGLTLTRRHLGGDEYLELAGFPAKALDGYLPKLVRAGHRVAICEGEDKEAPKAEEAPKPELISEDEYAALKALVDTLLPDGNGEIGWEPFDGEIAIFHLDDEIRSGRCACVIRSDAAYMMEFSNADGTTFREEARQLTKQTYNKVMKKLKETKEQQPKLRDELRDELRECALAQIPSGAEVAAARYLPIGEDNGKWQLILRMGDEYRYADIVAAARYLYVCDRVFATADEVKALVGIPLALPEPKVQPKAEEAPKDEPKEQEAPKDAVLGMQRMFMEQYGMENDAALLLAENNQYLYGQLIKEKSVEFRFRKKDGSERVAHGTLHPDVIPEIKADENKPKREPNPKFQTYWDLDKEQWRCFEKANLIDVQLPF